MMSEMGALNINVAEITTIQFNRFLSAFNIYKPEQNVLKNFKK